MKLAYKIFCLPLTNSKRVKLIEWIEEYADIYNFAAQFIPSLPEKYLKFKQPSLLYTKWIKGEKVERNVIPAQSAFCAISDAVSNYKSTKTINKIEHPNIIKFGNTSYRIIKQNDNYGFRLGGVKGIFVPLRIGEKQESVKERLDATIEHKTNVGIIIYNLRDNSVSIPYEVNSPHKFLKKDKIETFIGVDRGINNHVVLSAVDKTTFKVLGVKIISGMETKSKMQHLKKIANKRRHSRKEVGSKIHNIQNTNAHVISSEIVKFAVQYNNPVVIFEDLKSMKKNRLRNKHGGTAGKGKRRMIASWNYADLKTKTDYKLKLDGIWTFEVRAYMTSQECHRCGAIGIRDGIHFHCEVCGLGCGSNPQSTIGQYNADVNASINIALRGIYVLYGRKPGTVAVPIGQPGENSLNPIPTEMMGIGRYNSFSDRLDETTALYSANRNSLAVSDQPNAMASVVDCVPGNGQHSCLYKGRNTNIASTKYTGKTNISEVL